VRGRGKNVTVLIKLLSVFQVRKEGKKGGREKRFPERGKEEGELHSFIKPHNTFLGGGGGGKEREGSSLGKEKRWKR